MKQNQNNDGQVDRVRSGLQWLGSQVLEIKFGSIRGIIVRDGVVSKGPRFRVTRTGKPGSKYTPPNREALAAEGVLLAALRDLGRETAVLTGEWKLKVKIANGTLLSWDVEESGLSVIPETK
jgi:hypothetical protein